MVKTHTWSRLLACALMVMVAASVATYQAHASELTTATTAATELSELKADAVKHIKSLKAKYKSSITASNSKRLTSYANGIRKARNESAIATRLGKADVILTKAKLLHKQKARAVKATDRLYATYKSSMTSSQRGEYKTLKPKINSAKSYGRLDQLAEARTYYVSRAKLHKHINTEGWSKRRVLYVAEWGRRNNAYLSGSPMAGTGYLIVDAAYRNGIDPRLYSAIADIESGKGVAPHGNKYNVCGWVWNPPAMYSWADAANKWHAYFSDRFRGKSYPLVSMYGYCGYSPALVNQRMAQI